MAERSNAAVLKTVDLKVPGVRIPLSPQNNLLNAVPVRFQRFLFTEQQIRPQLFKMKEEDLVIKTFEGLSVTAPRP